ncbi:RtcB family protein [Bacillus sp. FJAT-42315]|uniref:RtcB family protein n=1 Tax=Bacillus sp. FJAT-42315 TaxID=2014077 RepID=UPI000C23A3C9|nr:RtcB family protein [Bacillus sp. FJAT-42315]
MLELNGKYNTAKVFTNNVEQTAMSQIIELCNQEFVQDSKIRIMPDTHAGAGCTIGTTMTIQDKIVPNLVGVDIGCGMEVAIIDKNKTEVNFDQLDDTIRKYVPSGFSVRSNSQRHPLSKRVNFRDVRAPFNLDRAKDSIGTLGGGNHFVELNEMDDKVVLVIHSGSRNLGKQIAEHYQKRAYDELTDINQKRKEMIERLTKEGRQAEIQEALQTISRPKVSKDLAYLEGQGFDDYMNDMKIAQEYAMLNRKAMVDEIVTRMRWAIVDNFTTIHNYIDMENMILRKGAISAQQDERVIVPINMRDGSIIAIGKGNPEWNFSGPHGAGRIMSRSKAKQMLSLHDFEDSMNGIWTTSVGASTLDEAPMVYKPINEIMGNIKESLTIEQVIKPLYNFKAN